MQVQSSNISRISIQSKNYSNISKLSPSTQPPDNPELKSCHSNELVWDQESHRNTELQNYIDKAERAQEEIEAKFKLYI